MGVVRATLQLGASTLVAVVGGNTRFAALKLEELRELCLPLVASRLVGGWHSVAIVLGCNLPRCQGLDLHWGTFPRTVFCG